MRQAMVVLMATVGLGFGGYAMAAAQDATPETTADGATCASPAATPTGATPPAAGTPTGADGCPTAGAVEVAVDIEDFAYDPDPVRVAVGGTVTWTNRDRASHTATGRDRDELDSGRLRQGESFDRAFVEGGEFAYRCAFHPNMTGTILVG